MKYFSVFAFLLLGVGACGGGASTTSLPDPPPPPPTGGIGRTGVAIGPISNFGSVVVNGVRYDTSAAAFTIHDAPGLQSDLSVGDVVTVIGTIDDNLSAGVATEVIFDDNVTGPIDSIDAAAGTLMVFGQPVIIGPTTSFDDSIVPASLVGLSVGDVVEVSGLIDSNGNIVATRIERKAIGGQLEVHGVVGLLDTLNSTFMLNALLVDYIGALLQNFPNNQISDGDSVEVKGMSLGPGGELQALEVQFESGGFDASDDGTHVEIEGFITRFGSAQDFAVAGVDVISDANTIIEGGSAMNLGPNVKVEVEGEINASGVLAATKIDIRQSDEIRVTALVDSVDTAAGSLVMLGISIDVDALTRFEDKSAAKVSPLNLRDINTGDYLEIRGGGQATGSPVRAALLEREDVDTRTELQGFVTAFRNPTLTVLGVTIETDASTVFIDTDDVTVLSAAEFFLKVKAGSLVKAKGTETTATSLAASEVELEMVN